MNYILFDDPGIRKNLLPFTFTRPVAGIRVGIYTIAEKWQKYLHANLSYKTQSYLQGKFPLEERGESIFINGAVCPDEDLVAAILRLNKDQALVTEGVVLAYGAGEDPDEIEYKGHPCIIRSNWDIFRKNGEQIREDFKLVSVQTSREVKDPHTRTYNDSDIFISPSAKIRAAVLNAENGPIYLGPGSEVQEGALIRGPFALCEGSVVNMGGKMRGDTTIGPYSKVGGEISNSVIFGYSNKSHDGFIGNTVIGEWCNLGADTNTSNLKNNYGSVSAYSFKIDAMVDTGLQFCGMMMGDHSKTSINSMINTGTVVGVMANIFGSGFPPKYVPSFSWGGSGGFEEFNFEKAIEVAQRVMERRKVDLSEEDMKILRHIYETARKS